MQAFLVAGSVVALVAAIGFLSIGIIATLRTGKPNAIYAFLFFVFSMLVLALYLFEWHFAFGRVGQEVAVTGAATSQNLSPQWFSAGGTIFLALITVFIAIVMPRWRKPKFKVEFDKKFCRTAEVPKDSYWLRLKVTNTGRSVAKRCFGKIVKFIDDSGERTDLDPVMLHWIGTTWGYPPYPPFFTPIDLNRGQHALLDVLVTKADSPGKAFIFTYGFLNGTNTTDILSGNGQIQITIDGDDVEPHTREYSIIWDNMSDYTSIRLEELK
jgi:hypothetical protein